MADHSMKMASNPNLTCPECGKIFPSEKSMYGHLRSHPERDYRGVNRQAPATKKNRKPPAKTIRDRAANTSDGNDDDDIDPEVVAALLLLSDPERLLDSPRSGFNDRNALDLDGYQPESNRRKIDSSGNRIYRCDTCFKVFSSHQALGGHVASHNKNKIVAAAASIHPDESEKGAAISEHKCKLCGMIFSSGQALGGHQRRHFKELCHHRAASPSALSIGGDEIASNQASASSPETEDEEEEEEEGPAKRRLLDFDLNMEPFFE